MSSSTKSYLKRDFAAGVYLSEAQNPTTPPYTLYTVYLFTQGKGEGGRAEPQRRGDGHNATFTKLGRIQIQT
jgi:hypothetical protein